MCRKFKFDHTNKWYMHNPASIPEYATNKLQWQFDILDQIISIRRSNLIIINKKKKRTCKIVELAVRADHRLKLMKSEKKNTSTLLGNWKSWNMKASVIPIVIAAFGTVTEILLKGLRGFEILGIVEAIQISLLLRTARILRRVLETWGDLMSLNLPWKTFS